MYVASRCFVIAFIRHYSDDPISFQFFKVALTTSYERLLPSSFLPRRISPFYMGGGGGGGGALFVHLQAWPGVSAIFPPGLLFPQHGFFG